MSKSAKGTAEQHGRNVKAKSGLNRSILDQGWYEMRRQLEYKQLWRGGQVLAVPTSQRCACCGHTAKENRLSQSKFVCQACGVTDVTGLTDRPPRSFSTTQAIQSRQATPENLIV